MSADLKLRYSKVSRRIWDDAKFRALSAPPPNGQTLFLRLLTGPELTCIPGLFPMGEAAMAEALGWELEGFREAFREVFAKGLARADWKARLVWVPNALKHNPPQSPNVVIAWGVRFAELPDSPLKVVAYQGLKAFLEGLGKAFAEAFGKGFADPLANHSQEQEQEQEQDPAAERDGTAEPKPVPATPAATPKPAKPKPDVDPSELDEGALAVASAIASDVTLGPIVKNRHQLAVDLVVAGPGINVPAAVKHAGSWLRANPTRAKRNGNSFLLGWVQRQQERDGGKGAPAVKAHTHERSKFLQPVQPGEGNTGALFAPDLSGEDDIGYPTH